MQISWGPLAALVAAVAAAAIFLGPASGQEQAPKKKAAYQEIEVTDGGAIVGNVTWESPRPTLDPFPIDKNPEVCQVGDVPNKPSRRLIISEDGGVKDTIVYIDGIEMGKPLSSLPKTQRLVQKNCEYHPRIFVIPRKGKLEMTTSDETLHNIHMYGAASYNLAFPIKGQVITRPFRKVGIARVVCDAGHGWMSATIHVVGHPYYAITGGSGNFRLDDVPPGKYTLKAWHEGWEVVEKESTKDPATGEEFIKGYVFSDPVIQSGEVEVHPSKESNLIFVLGPSTGGGPPARPRKPPPR